MPSPSDLGLDRTCACSWEQSQDLLLRHGWKGIHKGKLNQIWLQADVRLNLGKLFIVWRFRWRFILFQQEADVLQDWIIRKQQKAGRLGPKSRKTSQKKRLHSAFIQLVWCSFSDTHPLQAQEKTKRMGHGTASESIRTEMSSHQLLLAWRKLDPLVDELGSGNFGIWFHWSFSNQVWKLTDMQ